MTIQIPLVTRAAVGLVLVLAVCPPDAAGQTAVDPARGVSIDDLVATALRDAPSILAGRSREDEARGVRLQAGLRPNPVASVQRREEPGSAGYQTSLGFVWPLDLFRRDDRVSAAESGVAFATERTTEDEWRLATAVRRQAGRVLASVRRFEISTALAQAARQTLDLVDARVQSGAAPSLERNQAEIEWRRHEVQAIRIGAEVDTGLAALRALAGLEAGSPLRLRDDLETAVRMASESAAAAESSATAGTVDERPDVRVAGAAVDRAVTTRDLADELGRADASLTAGYARTRNGLPQRGLDLAGQPVPLVGRTHSLIVGMSVTLPWRNRNQGAVAAASAAVQTATHLRDAVRLAAGAEIAAAAFRESEARRALGLLENGTRDLASSNLDVVRESYTLGRATLVDVLDETRRYLDFEMAYTAALAEAFDAYVELKAVRGEIR